MKWIGCIVPFAMALINVPFFPSMINIVSCCICVGIGIAGTIAAIMN